MTLSDFEQSQPSEHPCPCCLCQGLAPASKHQVMQRTSAKDLFQLKDLSEKPSTSSLGPTSRRPTQTKGPYQIFMFLHPNCLTCSRSPQKQNPKKYHLPFTISFEIHKRKLKYAHVKIQLWWTSVPEKTKKDHRSSASWRAFSSLSWSITVSASSSLGQWNAGVPYEKYIMNHNLSIW